MAFFNIPLIDPVARTTKRKETEKRATGMRERGTRRTQILKDTLKGLVPEREPIDRSQSPRIYNTYWKLYDGGQEAGLSTLVGGLIGQMLESEGESIEGAYVPPIGSTDSLAYGALWYEPRQDASGF